MLSEQMLRIAEENLQTHIEIEKEEEYIKSLIKPLQIWISSASAPACYNLIPLLANGEVFGMATEVSIHLLDSSHYKEILHGIVMEAQDLAFPLLRSVSMHTELDDAFVQADIVILLDDILLQHKIPSLEDCIRQVTEQCKVYGSLIEKNANSSVKVIVSGKTFVNLRALMIMTFAPSIDGQNIIAMAMFLENAAKAMLARKLNMNSAGVKDVIVWGNISGNNYIDLSKTKVYRYDSAIWGPPNFSRHLLDMIYDGNWVRSEFASVLSSPSSREHHCLGMSPAHVIATVLRYWYQDSPPGEIVSMGILSKGRIWNTVDTIRQYWPPGVIPECSVVTALDSALNSDALARYTGKGLQTFESHFLFGQRGELTCTGHHTELIITGDHSVPESPKSSSMDRTGEALNAIQNSVYRTALKLRSVQTLCQLSLTDVSLIQHLLPSHQCQKEKQSSLTTQQLLQLLKELFQKARLDKPGQVEPQAPELTRNLLTAMYDRTGTGFIKARSAAAALIALSGDSLLTKYKALFQLYADPNGKGTLITRSAMRSLLTDLHQIPAIVGESCAQSCVEIAIRSCFHGVLNSAIGEEKFLSWLQSEPGLLLWLPTCYRLSATEMVMHHVRCSICKNFPITGLRPSTELSISPQPAHHYLSSPENRLAPESSKHLAEKGSAVQQIENDNRAPAQDKTSAQAIASIKAELLKAHESIKALHSEKRYLRKQLNKWKDKVLLLHNSQEDKSCRLEAKLQVLIANHESVQMELQQMRQEIKAMLQPPNHPSFVLCQNMMPKSEDPWKERKLHNGSDSALAKPIPTSFTELKSLDPSSSAEKRQLLQTQTDPAAMNLRSSGTTLGSIFLQNGNPLMRQHEKSKEKGIPQTDQEGISQPERTRNLPQGIMTTASSPTAAELPFNEKEVNEEKELQQLVLKLKDALSLQLQPAGSDRVRIQAQHFDAERTSLSKEGCGGSEGFGAHRPAAPPLSGTEDKFVDFSAPISLTGAA
ncbi:Putative malate dehydrogenase 1B [Chelonia mydas]|uniref:Putative malate dehydrogenase 1B n=1 Tax=Chelonia mydas TaxID=8469 RepID=M7AH95_CHEMY|nr:Putative malate dehydrogenase 1B [Chelonia mydas]